MKIVINNCYGGFSLSRKGIEEYYKRKGITAYFFKKDYEADYNNRKYIPFVEGDSEWFFISFSVPNPNDVAKEELWQKYYLDSRPEDRTDKDLVEVVESLGEESSGSCAKLKVIEIPDGINYYIHEYDGIESIEETHRSWN